VVREISPPPVPISSGHPPPSKGEEKEEKTLGGTPTAPPHVGAASPLEGEAEEGASFYFYTLRGNF